MYFEPVNCAVKEAEEIAEAYHKKMCEADNELQPLYKRLHKLEEICDNQYADEENELREKIYALEEVANKYDRYWDYWVRQAQWARERAEGRCVNE